METYKTSKRMQADNESILYLENALVEEVSTADGINGFVLVSFYIRGENNLLNRDLLKLIVSEDTILMNEFAEPLTLFQLEQGMYVDASFSSAMTRSLPPQTRAYQIIARQKAPNFVITIDRVVSIDVENHFLVTGNPYEMTDQMRFVISNATIILNRSGQRISLKDIKPGQMVRIEHASFQTLSIPPQTTAFRIQVLSID